MKFHWCKVCPQEEAVVDIPVWVALIYCPVTLGNFGWGPMGDGSQTVHAREWGQGLAKHHLQLGQWSSFPALSPRVDTIW